MTLPAGSMRHRITIQQPINNRDEYGGVVQLWVDVATVWARRTNTLTASAEAVAAGTTVAPVQARFDIRPRAIDPSWRLVGVGGDHDGVIYNIRNVGTSNDRSETAIIATSQLAEGDSGQGGISGGNAAGTGVGSISGGSA